MKKIITLFFTIVTLGYAEVGDYKSEFGVGVGLGIPSGYEFKGIYRYNEWLSLSLNYNLFQIKGFTEEINETDTQLTVTGDLIFSNPGIVLNYHPFGGNLKLMAGFLYDMGGLEVNADGNFNVEVDNNTIPTTVTGHIKIKLGQTYPYLGVAYGYDYESVVHLEASLGVYLVKKPEVDLYFGVDSSAAISDILDQVSGLSAQQKQDIIDALEASGGNILNLPTIAAEVAGVSGLVLPSEQSLEDDIALSLSALGIRIIAPIPGKGTIGIEVPNKNPTMVSMKSVIGSARFQEAEMELPIALGKTISNETFVVDLAKMPHLLMAGATGQGKSVGLNAVLTSLLYITL